MDLSVFFLELREILQFVVTRKYTKKARRSTKRLHLAYRNKTFSIFISLPELIRKMYCPFGDLLMSIFSFEGEVISFFSRTLPVISDKVTLTFSLIPSADIVNCPELGLGKTDIFRPEENSNMLAQSIKLTRTESRFTVPPISVTSTQIISSPVPYPAESSGLVCPVEPSDHK